MWEIIAKVFLGLNLLTVPVNYLPTINVQEDNTVNLVKQTVVSVGKTPHKIDSDSYGVNLSAVSAIVMDKNTGAILWQKNADEVRSIASITKLMTGLVFLEHNPGWSELVTMVTEDEAHGDAPEILRGEQVTVKNLFYTALIASDNNAIQALVRSTGLSKERFVALMNTKAQELKLTNTKFVDVTGLAEGNQSTAREVLSLAKIAFSQEDIIKAAQLPEYNFTATSGKAHRVFSTNRLFNSYLNIKAGKTGYIEAAGYCVVSEVADKDNNRIIGVVLGSDSNDNRFKDLKILTGWILENFNWS